MARGAIGQSSIRSKCSRLIVRVTHNWRDYHDMVVVSRFFISPTKIQYKE